jgi:SAM-dependent methyltransferase
MSNKLIANSLFNFKDHLYLNWLRPESALKDSVSCAVAKKYLTDAEDVLELGIGNGFYSFLLHGGNFKPDFDWFYSVQTENFWSNADIFDCNSNIELKNFILSAPPKKIAFAMELKDNLIKQANQLEVAEQIIQHDCNYALPVFRKYKTVYTNMIYWLKDPTEVLSNIGKVLTKGGQLIICFPNARFYDNCPSYRLENKLMRLINRGRASHILWSREINEINKLIKEQGIYEIEKHEYYLSPLTLRVWDIGLRPLSSPLIKMANSLNSELRQEIKEEWCETVCKFSNSLLENELEYGKTSGGYTIFKFIKK